MASLSKSLPKICVALGLPDCESLTRAADREIKNGSSFLEFRLDYLNSPEAGTQVIKKLSNRQPDTHILATCRRNVNHGGYNGSIADQLGILSRAIQAGAHAVDLEIETAERAAKKLAGLRSNAALVVSYHNFESTPALSQAWRRLRRIEADAYKLVTTARRPADNLRIIEFFRAKHDVPLIAFAMGEMGVPTRVLSLAAGCSFTYAGPVDTEGTAPGQLPANLMRNLYRAEKLSRHTKIYGVIADPVAHSKSPLIHNRALQARRIDAVYLPFRVAASSLGEWMKLAEALPVAGFSVTIPHKQRMMHYVDSIDPLARRIGAINTVSRKAGKWRGTNTDVGGILRPLEKHVRIAHSRILLAGYGGAARAAAFALRDAGADLTITGRNLSTAQSLAKATGSTVASLSDAVNSSYDILINATPVGMHPQREESFFPEVIPAGIVFDMVYNPHETALIRHALSQRKTVIHGIEMFLEQAAQQFEIWTGESCPRAVMRRAFED